MPDATLSALADFRLPVDRSALIEFCQRHHIGRLSLFGSVLRDDFGPSSDIDVLVAFEPDHMPGLAFFRMQEELSEMLGRRVDLNTVEDLPLEAREGIVRASKVQYELA